MSSANYLRYIGMAVGGYIVSTYGSYKYNQITKAHSELREI